MSITIHDEATATALVAATGEEEVRAADGRLLGRFIPAPKMSFPEFGITDEELEAEVQRLLTDPTIVWRTPEEVMARLGDRPMFDLIWPNPELDALADLYLAATPEERERMAAAVEALNLRLRDDPLNEGESRGENVLIVFIPLLTVLFHISTADRTVRVIRVRRYGR